MRRICSQLLHPSKQQVDSRSLCINPASYRPVPNIAVPPTILDEHSSSDVIARENSAVNLTCEARGSPQPELRWRRADGEMIRYKGGMGT